MLVVYGTSWESIWRLYEPRIVALTSVTETNHHQPVLSDGQVGSRGPEDSRSCLSLLLIGPVADLISSYRARKQEIMGESFAKRTQGTSCFLDSTPDSPAPANID